MKQNKKTAWSHLYALVLFAIVLLTVLFLVRVGTGVYSTLVKNQASNNAARANLAYVAARVRAADARGAVQMKDGPEGTMLVLAEEGGYETRVYLYRGSLMEEYASSAQACEPARASTLARTGTFDIRTLSQSLLEVVTDSGTVRVAVHSGIGGGA